MRRWVWWLITIVAVLAFLLVAAAIYESARRIVGGFKEFKTALDPATAERIRRTGEMPDTLNSRAEMIDAVSAIKAHGYGLFGASRTLPDGSILWLHSIELPGQRKDRCIVFREADGKLTKLDDCTYDRERYHISDVRRDGDDLTYLDPRGRTVPVTRKEPPRAAGAQRP
jgi:hypothetical protein